MNHWIYNFIPLIAVAAYYGHLLNQMSDTKAPFQLMRNYHASCHTMNTLSGFTFNQHSYHHLTEY